MLEAGAVGRDGTERRFFEIGEPRTGQELVDRRQRDGALGDRRHQVVVIGSGFGGLFTTHALKRAEVDVTMIARTNHHLFQPLLYQVATGILSEGEIAPSTREILSRQRNSRVLLGEVTDFDLAERNVTSMVLDQTTVTAYDSLIVAAGPASHTSATTTSRGSRQG